MKFYITITSSTTLGGVGTFDDPWLVNETNAVQDIADVIAMVTAIFAAMSLDPPEFVVCHEIEHLHATGCPVRIQRLLCQESVPPPDDLQIGPVDEDISAALDAFFFATVTGSGPPPGGPIGGGGPPGGDEGGGTRPTGGPVGPGLPPGDEGGGNPPLVGGPVTPGGPPGDQGGGTPPIVPPVIVGPGPGGPPIGVGESVTLYGPVFF